ncbi:MAG: 3-deoxy-7-phosphoheptulonate synthase class II, partial [Acidimicrobiaceae bacterium]|nr:3-deoxy-7-phosphoheptulonate synthase class II [Acidimicrobiaceae bacterium]
MAWTPWDWMERHAEQQPDWPDPLALETATKELSTFPPLVYPNEIVALKDALA